MLKRCSRCRSILAPWESEKGGCRCTGPRKPTLAEGFYAVLCSASGPLPIYDIMRLANQDHGIEVGRMTATTTLATDPRLCWAGRGVYGLYRHGPLPGARNLEQASRLVLAAVGSLHIDGVEFVLKQIGYRFATGSLRNAVSKSYYIGWDHGWWTHPAGEEARRQLRRDLNAVPEGQRAQFDEVIARLKRQGHRALVKREAVIAGSPRTVGGIAGIDWADG